MRIFILLLGLFTGFKTAAQSFISDPELKICPTNSKWTLCRQTGEQLLPVVYDTVITVNNSNNTPVFYFGYKGKYTLMKKALQIYTGEEFVSYIPNIKGGSVDVINMAGVVIQKDISGIITRLMSPYESGDREAYIFDLFDTLHYDFILAEKTLVFLKNKTGWGAIDPSGRNALPFIYDEINFDFDKLPLDVKQKGKWGVIDINGKQIIPLLYDTILEKYIDSLFYLAKGIESKLYSSNGNIILTGQIEDVFSFNELNGERKELVYKINGKYYRSEKVKSILKSDLVELPDSITSFKIKKEYEIDEHTGFTSKEYFVLENIFGNRANSMKYETLKLISIGFIASIKDSSNNEVYGFLDFKGKIIIPFVNSYLHFKEEGKYFTGIFEDKEVSYNSKGENEVK